MSRKRRRRIRRRKAENRRKQTAFIIAAVLLAGLAYLVLERGGAPEVAQGRLEDNPIYGPADAPVTITEFGDFTCSACRSWHKAGIIFQIVEQYDGLVRLEWRDLPIITADSPKAAEAGQCAHDQGRFWEYLDRVYAEPGSSYTNARPVSLLRYASEIGLDMQAFSSCMDENRHQETVAFDLSLARGMGLNGTPSFSVNDTRIIGGTPDAIVRAVEAALRTID